MPVSLLLVFGPDDPARVRFAESPIWETMSALRLLLEPHRRTYHLPWLDSVRPELDRLDLWPLLALSPRNGWTPDFLSPAPASRCRSAPAWSTTMARPVQRALGCRSARTGSRP